MRRMCQYKRSPYFSTKATNPSSRLSASRTRSNIHASDLCINVLLSMPLDTSPAQRFKRAPDTSIYVFYLSVPSSPYQQR